jgi:hypothetical protein
MADLAPIDNRLWQKILTASIQKYAKPHDNWRVRQRTVRRYLAKAGKFTNLPEIIPNRLLIINALRSQGIEITANLMIYSLDYQWRQYLGRSTIAFDDFAKNAVEPLILRNNNYFGVKASALGYQVMLPTSRKVTIAVPLAIGYTLISLSRPLAPREKKFANNQ